MSKKCSFIFLVYVQMRCNKLFYYRHLQTFPCKEKKLVFLKKSCLLNGILKRCCTSVEGITQKCFNSQIPFQQIWTWAILTFQCQTPSVMFHPVLHSSLITRKVGTSIFLSWRLLQIKGTGFLSLGAHRKFVEELVALEKLKQGTATLWAVLLDSHPFCPSDTVQCSPTLSHAGCPPDGPFSCSCPNDQAGTSKPLCFPT